jgi:hypothetical protein
MNQMLFRIGKKRDVTQQIISGAQTGAGLSSIDVVIEKDIPYSGWIPEKGDYV